MAQPGCTTRVLDEWRSLCEMEELFDAVDCGDEARVASLRSRPEIEQRIEYDFVARQQFITSCGIGPSRLLVAEAVARIAAEPALVRGLVNWTPLHSAAQHWAVPFAEALLAAGADPNALDPGGHTPLYLAANGGGSPEEGFGVRIVEILIAAGADPNGDSGVMSCTPLHMAARRGYAGIAAALLRLGADPAAQDRRGDTPLQRAINCRRPAVAELLSNVPATLGD